MDGKTLTLKTHAKYQNPAGIKQVAAFGGLDEPTAYAHHRSRASRTANSADNALFFHGHDAETAFADYIDGRREFSDVLKDYRR